MCVCVGEKGLTGYGESFIQGFKKKLQANIGKFEWGILVIFKWFVSLPVALDIGFYAFIFMNFENTRYSL